MCMRAPRVSLGRVMRSRAGRVGLLGELFVMSDTACSWAVPGLFFHVNTPRPLLSGGPYLPHREDDGCTVGQQCCPSRKPVSAPEQAGLCLPDWSTHQLQLPRLQPGGRSVAEGVPPHTPPDVVHMRTLLVANFWLRPL